jgi:hypothetical protein
VLKESDDAAEPRTHLSAARSFGNNSLVTQPTSWNDMCMNSQLTGLALGASVGIGILVGWRALSEKAFSNAVSDGDPTRAEDVLRNVFWIEEWAGPLALLGLGVLLLSDDSLAT